MTGPGDAAAGSGFKRTDHTLESDFTLDAGQEDVVCVDLEGEWSEQSRIFLHPGYKNTDIQFVSGEVGEGGDHMNITFKNISDHSVTIAGDVTVVFISEDPNEPDPNESKAKVNEQEEKEKIEREKAEKEKQEQQKLEKERLEKEKLEKERLEKERQEKERLQKEK